MDNYFMLQPMKLNYLNCTSIETVYSIELKFATNIRAYLVMYRVDFGEYRSNSISIGAKRIILMH